MFPKNKTKTDQTQPPCPHKRVNTPPRDFSPRRQLRYGILRGPSRATGQVLAIATEHGSRSSRSRAPCDRYCCHRKSMHQYFRLGLSITLKCLLLGCVWGAAFAVLVVHVLGPPSQGVHEHATARMQRADNDEGVLSLAIDGYVESVLPGWTSLGHHLRFLGQEAFPEHFEGWREEGGEHMVVNTVDVGPLAPDGEALPSSDILLVILSAGTKEARLKRDVLREVYDKYEGWVTGGGKQLDGTWEKETDFSFRVVFVVSNPSAPPGGQLVGDMFYVNAPDGYYNIVQKVKHMMGLVKHSSFKYLLKADDDTFVCLRRVANFLLKQPPENKDKIFAGVPTACNLPTNPHMKSQKWQVGEVIKDPQEKWYDHKFVQHTLAGLDCFPVYMQGAFYVLAYPLVEHLYRGRDHYDTFVNEDVTMGSWLLGVDRAIETIHDFASANLWTCTCGGDMMMRTYWRRTKVFFHNCKAENQLRKCSGRLFRPSLHC